MQIRSPEHEARASAPADLRPDDRRRFLEKIGAVVIGALLCIFPVVAGLFTFFDPLRRRTDRKAADRWMRVATLDALPADNVPRRFQVIAPKTDAWAKYEEPIGAVYLTRAQADQPPTAITTTCPHLGCAVDYHAADRIYKCPCHTSAFQVDGQRMAGPSPRDLDTLEVEVRNGSEIWVKFEKFRVAISEKIAEA